jgi:hypothetical protein
MFWGTPKKSIMPGSNSETRGGSVMVWEVVSWYSVGPINTMTLHGRITARKYVDRSGNQVHHMIQMLFLNNSAVFQDNNAPNHTVGTA